MDAWCQFGWKLKLHKTFIIRLLCPYWHFLFPVAHQFTQFLVSFLPEHKSWEHVFWNSDYSFLILTCFFSNIYIPNKSQCKLVPRQSSPSLKEPMPVALSDFSGWVLVLKLRKWLCTSLPEMNEKPWNFACQVRRGLDMVDVFRDLPWKMLLSYPFVSLSQVAKIWYIYIFVYIYTVFI